MNDIAFNRALDLPPDQVDEPMPGIRRVMADNPGPFTFKGTMSYIIGRGKVAILDPGPDDARHVAALLDAVRGETVTHILVSHTHLDHSPAVTALKAATGAPVYAEGPHRPSRPLHQGDKLRPADRDFRPDRTLADGEIIEGEGWSLEAVTTPGHCANHLAFALRGTDILFSADQVMGWSTSIVAPPDGSMRDYVASLRKLLKRDERIYFPGHGPHIADAKSHVRGFIAHRKAREEAILRQLAAGESDIPAMVHASYGALEPRLVAAAGLSTLAHLEDLVERGVVATDGPPRIDGIYRLAASR
jgi:glyoxylase-like metal-dependent hydrolase (beta-lactamase superfamily II)